MLEAEALPDPIWYVRDVMLFAIGPAMAVWSPEQIARRLELDYLEGLSMGISHEAICQALYIQSVGR